MRDDSIVEFARARSRQTWIIASVLAAARFELRQRRPPMSGVEFHAIFRQPLLDLARVRALAQDPGLQPRVQRILLAAFTLRGTVHV